MPFSNAIKKAGLAVRLESQRKLRGTQYPGGKASLSLCQTFLHRNRLAAP